MILVGGFGERKWSNHIGAKLELQIRLELLIGWGLCSDCLVAIPSLQPAPLSPLPPIDLGARSFNPHDTGLDLIHLFSNLITIRHNWNKNGDRTTFLKESIFPTNFLSNPVLCIMNLGQRTGLVTRLLFRKDKE